MSKASKLGIVFSSVFACLLVFILSISIASNTKAKAETISTDGFTFRIPQYATATTSEVINYLTFASSQSSWTALVDNNGNQIALTLQNTDGFSVISTHLYPAYSTYYQSGNYVIYFRFYQGAYMSGNYYYYTYTSSTASSGKFYTSSTISSSNSSYNGYNFAYLVSKYGLVNTQFAISGSQSYTPGPLNPESGNSRTSWYILYNFFRASNEDELYWDGYNYGFQDGFRDGKEEGYDIGFDYGQEVGYDEGYIDGISESNANINTYSNVLNVAWKGASDFLNTKVFGEMTILHLILIPLTLGILIIIIKLIRG